MKNRLRILSKGILVGVLAFALDPQLVRAGTVLYATDLPNKRIWAVDVTNGVNTLVTTLLDEPDSIVFAPNGNMIYSLERVGKLGSFDGTTNKTLVSSGLVNPGDMTLEPSRTSVLISDILAGKIFRYDLGTQNLTMLADFTSLGKGLKRVDGLAYDNSSRLFAVINQNEVAQINPVNGAIIKELTGLTGNLDGLTFDPVTGDLWASAFTANSLLRIPVDLSGSTSLASGMIASPDGLVSDGIGNIFVAGYQTNIYQYNIASKLVTKQNAVPGLDDLAPLVGLGAPIPEPSSWVLFGSGFLALAAYSRRATRLISLRGRIR